MNVDHARSTRVAITFSGHSSFLAPKSSFGAVVPKLLTHFLSFSFVVRLNFKNCLEHLELLAFKGENLANLFSLFCSAVMYTSYIIPRLIFGITILKNEI